MVGDRHRGEVQVARRRVGRQTLHGDDRFVVDLAERVERRAGPSATSGTGTTMANTASPRPNIPAASRVEVRVRTREPKRRSWPGLGRVPWGYE